MSDAGTFPNPPEQVVLAGDKTDDDGTVIAELTQENPWPPTPDELPTAPESKTHVPLPLNRLLTTTTTVRASQYAVMILPPDPYRTHMNIQIVAAAVDTSAYLYLSDDLGKVQMSQGSALLVSGASIPDLEGFTGPLYVLVPQGDGLHDYGMTVSITAVTR